MEALLLGISSGAVCLAYCAPVLVPCLLAEGDTVARSAFVVMRFLAGRLAGYLAFGVLAWVLGRSVLQMGGMREIIVGAAYMAFSIMLVAYGFFGRFHRCEVSVAGAVAAKLARLKGGPFLVPLVAGFVTGLNFCPPFLLATAAAAAERSLAGSLLFFFLFFIGTSLFLIPAPALGFLRRFPAAAAVGKLAAGVVGLYYFYSGLIMCVGGAKAL